MDPGYIRASCTDQGGLAGTADRNLRKRGIQVGTRRDKQDRSERCGVWQKPNTQSTSKGFE